MGYDHVSKAMELLYSVSKTVTTKSCNMGGRGRIINLRSITQWAVNFWVLLLQSVKAGSNSRFGRCLDNSQTTNS